MNLVTVIIPIYNMAGFLPEAVQSVIDNNFAHTEIIIVDDGSTDHSLKVAKRIVRKTQTKSIRVETKRIAHRGKSFAVNEALKMATGDFITFLDADDKLPGSSLDLRVRKLQTAEADIALGEFEVFSNEKVTGRRKICANNISSLKSKMIYSWKTPFHLNAMLIKKEIINRVGFFDEKLLRGQEKDYALRLLKSEADISFIQAPVYQYRRYRSLNGRLRLRVKTFKYKIKLLGKYTSGMQKTVVLTWNITLEFLKLIFNLFGSYKK